MKKKKLINKRDTARLIDESTPFAVRESFNQLRTNLMYTLTEVNDAPIYAIASVSEDSGKSTLIANLAFSFSQIGKKVLLVDGDMRCPTIYRYWDLDPAQAGLSELISGISTDVVTKDVHPNLDVITSGRIPPNPSELLASPRMKLLIEEWKNTYDIIFFDFPPIAVVADALSFCTDVTGYIFTVRSGHNHSKEIISCVEHMDRLGAKIVGVVLNDYNIKGSSKRNSRYASGYSSYGGHYKSRYEAKVQKMSAEMKSLEGASSKQ